MFQRTYALPMTAYAVPTLVAPIEPIGTSNNMNVDMSNNIVKISNPITTTVNARIR